MNRRDIYALTIKPKSATPWVIETTGTEPWPLSRWLVDSFGRCVSTSSLDSVWIPSRMRPVFDGMLLAPP